MKNSKLNIVIIVLLVWLSIYQYYSYNAIKSQQDDINRMSYKLENLEYDISNRIDYSLTEKLRQQNALFQSVEQNIVDYDMEKLTYDMRIKLVPKYVSDNAMVFVSAAGKNYEATKEDGAYVADLTLDATKEYQLVATIDENGTKRNQADSDLYVETMVDELFPLKNIFDYSTSYHANDGDELTLEYELGLYTGEMKMEFKQIVLVAEQGNKIISEKDLLVKSNSFNNDKMEIKGKDKFNAKSGEDIRYTLIAKTKANYSYEVSLVDMNEVYYDNGGVGISEKASSAQADSQPYLNLVIKNPKGEIIYGGDN